MENSEIFNQAPHPAEVSDYYHILNLSNIANIIYWSQFFEKINEIEGDIVECGVGRGRSLLTILSLNLLKIYSKNERNIYALDSFEGFPEPSADDNSPRFPKKGDWSHSPNNQFQYSVENLKKIIELANLDIYTKNNKLNIVKGFFNKTTKNLNTQKIALLHLDGDLYSSIKDPLDNLSEKIADKGIIVIDDFYLVDKDMKNEPFPGARKAVEEFLKKNKEFDLKESIRGTPYLIKNN